MVSFLRSLLNLIANNIGKKKPDQGARTAPSNVDKIENIGIAFANIKQNIRMDNVIINHILAPFPRFEKSFTDDGDAAL